MKATKEYYLKHRNLFIQLGFINEVQRLDYNFKLVFLCDKFGNIIKVL